MAKNVKIANVNYNNVPALDIPLQNSGYARFYDVEGSQEYQQNGTYDVTTLSQIVVNVSGGSGATNIVKGTFTTGSSTAAAESHTIPYTGSGYPIAFFAGLKAARINPDPFGITLFSVTPSAFGAALKAIQAARRRTQHPERRTRA